MRQHFDFSNIIIFVQNHSYQILRLWSGAGGGTTLNAD